VCSLARQSGLQAVGHGGDDPVRLAERRHTRRPQRVALASSPSSLRRRITDPGLEEALALEPIERRVDGTDRDVSPRAVVNLLSDLGYVRLFVGLEAQDRQEDELLEVAKD